jgi:hypothetical protein
MFVSTDVAANSRRARASRLLTAALRKAGATSEPASVPLPTNDRFATAQLARLVRLGAVKQGRNGYWLDEERYREIRHARLRLLAIVLILEAAFILTLALYLPRHH